MHSKQQRREPQRYPRLNAVTVALIGKKNCKTSERLHRALEMMSAAETAGMDVYNYLKILDSAS
jgi:hypothetical protein